MFHQKKCRLNYWLARPWPEVAPEEAGRQLVRKFLHCYGPSNQTAFNSWLGCSPRQGKRLWQSLSAEVATVWRTISNPGVILSGGQIIGIWQDKSPEIKLQAFEPLSISEKQHLQKLIEALLDFKN